MTACLLTFDVEDWFQVENLRPLFPPESWESMSRRVTASTRVILRLLEEQRIPATFFILGWVAEHEPALVEEIAAAGHEIASHGYGHILPLALAPGEFRTDVLRARSVLETVSRREVVGYRAPSFSIDRKRLAILADCGFRYDSSHHPFALHGRYGRLGEPGSRIWPGVYRVDGKMIELELPVEKVGPLRLPASGGGYFRLYPGSLFRHLARKAADRMGHFIMYLHSWEFDPGQPRVRKAGLFRTFRHYNNLSRTLARIERLITMMKGMDARFLTASQFLQEIGNGCTSESPAPSS